MRVCVCVCYVVLSGLSYVVYWFNIVAVAVFMYDVCAWECATVGYCLWALLSLLSFCFMHLGRCVLVCCCRLLLVFLGSPVVPFCPLSFCASLIKTHIVGKSVFTLIIKGPLGNLGIVLAVNAVEDFEASNTLRF